MDPIVEKIKPLSGGKILDVATSFGDFLRLLTESFKDYIEAIGIDRAEDRIADAQKKSPPELDFRVANAEHIEFDDNYFDTAAIRHSLHHLDNPDVVLNEMMRVLKPGGLMILCEIIQCPELLKENAERHLHHWWAEVDRTRGVPHFDTYTKEEVLKITDKLKLKDTTVFEYLEEPDESESKEILDSMLAACDDHLKQLRENNGSEDLIQKGEELKNRFKKLGFGAEKFVYVLGRK